MSADTQIKAIFARWERLEGEKKAISDDLKELFSEAKHAGYDGKALRAAFNRKVKQDAATPEDAHFDAVVDVYLDALNGAAAEFTAMARDVRMHARENIEEFDPETGELKDDGDRFGTVKHMREQIELARNQSPRNAAEAVSERTAVTDATIVSVLVEADKAEAVAGVSGQPETIPALTVQHDGVNVGGPERAGVTAGETATQFHAKASDDACEAGRKALDRAKASADAPDGAELVIRGVGDRAPTATSEEMDATAGETAPNSSVLWNEWQASKIDPNEDRSEGQSLDGGMSSVGANTGGDHVTGPEYAATHQAGASFKAPPAKSLRPHCLKPDACGGYGSNHCFSCKKAAKAEEVAA